MTAAAAPVPVATTRELGSANLDGQLWWQRLEVTPELQWPRCIPIYDAMRRQDSQVKSVLRAITLPIRRTGWRLRTGPARPEVAQHVAEDLGLALDDQPRPSVARGRGRFSWSEHLQMALLDQAYGHMFFEQVYRVDHPGPGGTHLRKLAPRMPATLAAINVATDGGLESIEQHPPVGVRPRWLTPTGTISIPVGQLVAYVNDREGGDWLGQSVLRAAYKNWLIKDRLLRVDAQTIERNGMGVPLYKGAPGETDLEAGRTLATQWRSGEAAGAAVPNEADLVLRGVEGTLPNAMASIRYHDEQIARGVLAHFLNLGTQTGSWALGSTFADFFVQSEQAVAESHRDVAQHHVVEDLVDVNWGPDEPAPLLEFDEIGSRHDATAQAIKLLLDSGAVVPDQSMEEFIRTAYGLPPKDLRLGEAPAGPVEPTDGGQAA